jgi:hypothetical protein
VIKRGAYSKRKKKTYLAVSITKLIRIIRTENVILSAKKTLHISVKKSLQLMTVRKCLLSEPAVNKRFFCGKNIDLVTLNLVKGVFINM